MSIKVQGQVVITDDKKGLFDKVNPGAYTTTERDALSPAIGDIVYNSQDEELQVWNGVEWSSAGSGSGGIGTPVDVLTPIDGAGVGGAFNYRAKTDAITDVQQTLNYGRLNYQGDMNLTGSHNYTPLPIIEAANGRLIAVAEYGGITYSDDDGLTWTSPVTPGEGWKDVVYEPVTGNVVACGTLNSSKTMYSTDNGETWNQGTQPGATFYKMATNGSGRIVATGQAQNQTSAPRFYSDNGGVSWSSCNRTSQNYNKHQYRSSIAYGNGKWVCGADWSSNGARNAYPEYSSDGVNWTYSTSGNSSYHASQAIVWCADKNLFVDIGKTGSSNYVSIGKSSNGINWTWDDLGYGSEWNINSNAFAIVYGNGIWIKSLSDVYGYQWSTNLTTWYRGTLPNNYSYDRVSGGTFAKGRFWINDNYSTRSIYKGSNAGYGSQPAWRNDRLNLTYNLTFASTDVIDQSQFNIIDGADFVNTFDRALVRSVDGYYVGIPDEIGAGTMSFNHTNLSLNYDIGGYVYTSAELTEYGPSPTALEFTSSNAGTAPFSGTEATLAYRTWTLETRASDSDPWTVVTTEDDYSPAGSQNGATPWAGKPTLTADTQYRVKVEYHSANARSVESDYSYFTTGPS